MINQFRAFGQFPLTLGNCQYAVCVLEDGGLALSKQIYRKATEFKFHGVKKESVRGIQIFFKSAFGIVSMNKPVILATQ